jgi:hypothetical protein
MNATIYTPAQIAAMREWAADCQWRDNDDLDLYEDATIIAGVERHYDGGVKAFLRDSEPWPEMPDIQPITTKLAKL